MRINTASVVLACLLATAEVFAVPVEDNSALVGRAGKTKPPPVKPPPTKPPPKSVAPPPPPKSVPPPPPPKSVTPPPPKSSVVPPPPKSSAPPPPPKSSAPPVKSSQPVSSLPPKSSVPASSKPIPPVSSSSMRALSSSAAPSSSLPMSSVLPASSSVFSSAVSAASSVASSASQSLPGSISASASSAQSSAPSSVVSPASSVITSAASSGSLVPSSSASVLGSAVSSGSADPLASSASGSAVSSSAASVITSAASSGSQSASVSVSDSASALSSDAASSVSASSVSGSASASSASASASASAVGVCAPRASGVSRRSSPQGSDGGVGDESFCSWNDPNDSSYIYSEGDIGDDTIDLIDPVDPHNPPASDRVLRFPRRDWLLEGALPADPNSCQDNPDNCDNGGSGNCVLTEDVFNFDPSGPGTPPPGTPPQAGTPPDRRSRFRFIRGNATYKFLPGESMIARQLTPRANKELIFNCNEQDPASLPEVCNNMCYGLNCLQINNEFKRETNTQQCAANRKKNACAAAVPNPCSARFNGAGGKASLRNVRLSCDEFPFASTDVATAMTNNNLIATRCVDAKHNSRQGGKIGGFYRYVLGAGESFEVKFDYGNANGAQGSNDGPAGSATMGYCKTGVAKGNGQTCDKDPMQMN